MALVRSLAGVLAAAHRLGLAHGRLGADQVFLTAEGQVKLDFSGASVGFPRDWNAGTDQGGRGSHAAEAGSLAALRSADLLRPGRPDRAARCETWPARRARMRCRITAREDVALAKLARELMAEDPAERPLAHEVQARLATAAAPDGRHRRLERARSKARARDVDPGHRRSSRHSPLGLRPGSSCDAAGLRLAGALSPAREAGRRRPGGRLSRRRSGRSAPSSPSRSCAANGPKNPVRSSGGSARRPG